MTLKTLNRKQMQGLIKMIKLDPSPSVVSLGIKENLIWYRETNSYRGIVIGYTFIDYMDNFFTLINEDYPSKDLSLKESLDRALNYLRALYYLQC